MLEIALKYAEMGFSVIPVHTVEDGVCSCGSPHCNAPGKHPRYKWKGQTEVAASREQIESWWGREPNSNIGIVTGSVSGIAVVDIDGEEGLSSLSEAGLPIDELPPTLTAKTGGGGLHLIYRNPESEKIKTSAGLLPNVDIRAEGGFIVAPPSKHESGDIYEWVEGRGIDDIYPTDFDFSILLNEKPVKDTNARSKEKWYERYLLGVGEGERNDATSRLAGRYFSMGMTENEVIMLLESWNLNNSPPLPTEELRRVVRSIHNRENEEKGREELLEFISGILRVNLSSVKRITGDEPQIIMEFDEGTCIMNTAQLLSPKGFQQAVAEATKVVVRRLSTKSSPTHDKLVQMIMDCSEDVDAGLEATGTGELLILIKDFVGNQQVISLEQGDMAPHHGCFEHGGYVWVGLADLMQRSGARWGIRTSMRQMAQQLRALGMERKVFDTEDGGTRIMWGIRSRMLE